MSADRDSNEAVPIPTLSDIVAGREALEGVSVYTPMEESRWLSEAVGGPVHLKAENLQRTGSFKIRGAYLRMSRLSESERAHGVVAASAGNHAQGVALAAQLLGIRATVFMPDGAPIPKEKATRGYGADVRFHGQSVDEALVEAKRFAAETGAVLIHPFDHFDIVTGQGTCGLEILEQCPDVKTVVVSTGGGGFIAGIATAIKSLRPDVRVVGVQAEGAAAFVRSLAEGHPIPVGKMDTMADGIAVGCPGEVPFRAIQQYVDEVVTVSEEGLSRALLMLLERAKLVVEPAGAAAVAALLDHPDRFETPAVAVLSGGNIDPLLLMRVIRHGLAAAGRYLFFRVRIPDSPGGLAHLLGELAEVEANVLDVVHERTSAQLHLDEVEVAMQVETRSPEHAGRVLARLRERGYVVDD
jgi:threonine dehydratase